MIDLEKIIYILDQGYSFKIKKKSPSKEVKGTIFPNNSIEIYPENIEDERDYKLTICHEFFHAFYDMYDSCEEKFIEEAATNLEKNYPEKVDDIMAVFNIPPYKNVKKDY